MDGVGFTAWWRRMVAVACVGVVLAVVLIVSDDGGDPGGSAAPGTDETTTTEATTSTTEATTTTTETTTTVPPTTTTTAAPPTTAPPTTSPQPPPVTPTVPPPTVPSVPPEFPFVRRGYTEGPAYYGLTFGQVPCCDRSHIWAVCQAGPVTVTIIDNGSVDPVQPPLSPSSFGVWVDETTLVRDMAPAADGTVITGTVTSTIHIVLAGPSNLPVRVQYDCRG